MDFKSLNTFLIPHVLEILTTLLPGGRLAGREYQCGNSAGGVGNSLRYNLDKLTGSDFATGESYGDIIDLYSKIRNVSMLEAAKQLAEKHGYKERPAPVKNVRQKPPSPTVSQPEIVQPGASVGPLEPLEPLGPLEPLEPNFWHYLHGAPVGVWKYPGAFYIARYDTPGGKQFFPWTLIDGVWTMKSPPKPRPLYNMAELTARPGAPVLVVEGEGTAEAARLCAGDYVVTTWPNGAASVNAADWEVLRGRSVTIWPDADEPGRKAAEQIADKLSPLCPEIKILNVDDHDNGWDAADANFEWESFNAWVAPRITPYVAIAVAVTPQAAAVAVAQVTVQSEETPAVIKGSHMALWLELGIGLSGQGIPICNIDNVVRFFEQLDIFRNFVWYDEFHNKIFTTWGGCLAREWTDEDDLRLTFYFQRELGVSRLSDLTVHSALRVYAHQHKRNEPRDWFDSLEWDGKQRINDFFVTHLGAEATLYSNAASRNFWIGMCARVYRPGCQLDNMVVLEGPQGTFKTSALRAIGGTWHTEAHESVTSNNFFMALQGKLIVEIGELDSFSRAEITKIKHVISNPTDRYRTPYDRISQDHPRQSMFVGTTNETHYLRDSTGGRRFWPIRCGRIDLPAITTDRAQLFAEAAAAYQAGEEWYIMPASVTEAMQEDRRQVDVWEDVIYDWLARRVETTTQDIAVNCLRIEIGKISRGDEMRIANCMRALRYTQRRTQSNNDRRRYWVKT